MTQRRTRTATVRTFFGARVASSIVPTRIESAVGPRVRRNRVRLGITSGIRVGYHHHQRAIGQRFGSAVTPTGILPDQGPRLGVVSDQDAARQGQSQCPKRE